MSSQAKPKAGDNAKDHTKTGVWKPIGDGRLYNPKTGEYARGSGGGYLKPNNKGKLVNT